MDAVIAEQARGTLEQIRRHGWNRGRMVSHAGEVCLRGAWRLAVGGQRLGNLVGLPPACTLETEDSFLAAFREKATELFPGHGITSAYGRRWAERFNDARDRRREDVEQVLEKMACG